MGSSPRVCIICTLDYSVSAFGQAGRYVIRQAQHIFENLQHIRKVMRTTQQLNSICGLAAKGQPENLQTSTEEKSTPLDLPFLGRLFTEWRCLRLTKKLGC